MFFILLGIVLIALVFWSASFIKWDAHMAAALIIVIFISAILLGVFEPVAGYRDEKIAIEETELVNLTGDVVSTGGGIIYLNIEAGNVYRYCVEVDSVFATGDAKAYKSYVLSGETVTYVEDESYETAKLVKYKVKPKRNFWTFAVGAAKYEYVFYVPKGTVRTNISLG